MKVGKTLEQSGTQAWTTLSDAIDFAIKWENIPGKNLFFIERKENKIYFYGKSDNGMSSNKNDSGADTWAFQSSSIDNSTSSSSRYVVSLQDAKTKEDRMSIIRERMQKGTKSPIMSAQMAQIQNKYHYLL